MPKGKVIPLDFHVFQDPDTGATVTRLTPPEIICHRNYFYQKCFTQDGSKLIFGAEFEGRRNYYLLDLRQQQALQLTEGEGDNTFGGFLSPDDQYLYYVKNERFLQKVRLSDLAETTVYQVPDAWVGYGTWVANSDCTSMVGIEIAKADWTPLTDWKVFRDFYTRQPHCRLLRVDLATGEATVILDANEWLGHPIYRPHDDNTVAFCHEGPHDLVDARMWLINQDGSQMRKVKEHAEGESCTHEFWVPNGQAMIYVSYLKGEQDRRICRFNPDTGVNEELMLMPACSHLMSNEDGTMLVGDGADAPVDVSDSGGYSIQNDPWLYIFDVATRRHARLSAHNSSWKVLNGDRQVTHPHPSFSPDNKQVLYTSDCDGKPALYLVNIEPQLFN